MLLTEPFELLRRAAGRWRDVVAEIYGRVCDQLVTVSSPEFGAPVPPLVPPPPPPPGGEVVVVLVVVVDGAVVVEVVL